MTPRKINLKFKIQNLKLLALGIIALLLVSSCASGRIGYHKPRKPSRKCDCSRWSYNLPVNTYFLFQYEERSSGRT